MCVYLEALITLLILTAMEVWLSLFQWAHHPHCCFPRGIGLDLGILRSSCLHKHIPTACQVLQRHAEEGPDLTSSCLWVNSQSLLDQSITHSTRSFALTITLHSPNDIVPYFFLDIFFIFINMCAILHTTSCVHITHASPPHQSLSHTLCLFLKKCYFK